MAIFNLRPVLQNHRATVLFDVRVAVSNSWEYAGAKSMFRLWVCAGAKSIFRLWVCAGAKSMFRLWVCAGAKSMFRLWVCAGAKSMFQLSGNWAYLWQSDRQDLCGSVELRVFYRDLTTGPNVENRGYVSRLKPLVCSSSDSQSEEEYIQN